MNKKIKRMICCVCTAVMIVFTGCDCSRGGNEGKNTNIFDGTYEEVTRFDLEKYAAYESKAAMDEDFFSVAHGGKLTLYYESQNNKEPWKEQGGVYGLTSSTLYYVKTMEGNSFLNAVCDTEVTDTSYYKEGLKYKTYVENNRQLESYGINSIRIVEQNFATVLGVLFGGDVAVASMRRGFALLSNALTAENEEGITVAYYLDTTDNEYQKVKTLVTVRTIDGDESREEKNEGEYTFIWVFNSDGKICAYYDEMMDEYFYREKNSTGEWGEWELEFSYKQRETYEHWDGEITPPSEFDDILNKQQ